MAIRHIKTDTIPDWTQPELDAQIALGNYPSGTLLADIVLPSDWNADHTNPDIADVTGLQAAPSAAGAGKNLVIRGVRIDTMNLGAAVATTATVLQWGLGVGSTAVSLATADSATAGTRAPRRLTLGVQSFAIGAAIGSVAAPVDVNLDAPLYVSAGTFVHVILKMPVGTATASQIIRGTVLINGFWE